MHQGYGRCVHDLEAFFQNLKIVQPIVPFGIRIDLRVRIVNAVDFGPLQDHVSPDFHRSQGRRRVGGEVGTAGAGSEDDDAFLFQMPDGSPPNEGLRKFRDMNGTQDPGRRRHFSRGRSAKPES